MGETDQGIVVCTRCGESKAANLFHRNRRRPSGLSWWCKQCNLATAKARNERGRQSEPGSHFIIPPDAPPDRMRALAIELARLVERQFTCRTCRRRFVANVTPGGGGAPWCPRCIDRRVARVLAQRETQEKCA